MDDLISTITHQSLDCWSKLHPELPKPGKLSHLIQSRNQIIVHHFLDEPNQNRPVMISKIARFKNQNHQLENSCTVAQLLKRKLSNELSSTIPLTVSAGEPLGLKHIVMKPVEGRQMRIHPNNRAGIYHVARDFHAYSSWLRTFQSETMLGIEDLCADKIEERNLNEYETHYLTSLSKIRLSDVLEDIAKNLEKVSIPIAWGYGDAHHSNLFLEGNRISGVIDWSGDNFKQVVLYDWFYFIFMYSLEFLKRNFQLNELERVKKAMEILFQVNKNRFSEVIHEETVSFLSHHHCDPSLFPSLFMMFLFQLYYPENKHLLIEKAIEFFNYSS